MKLNEYLDGERGRVARVAKQAGIAAAYLSQISNGVRPAAVPHCPAIARACDFEVRLWDLRPRDWHRIWPDLVGSYGAPAPAAAVAEPQAT